MLRALVKTFRIRQWTKNAFVLTALVFDLKLTDPVSLSRSLIAFFLFCLLSSAVYVINDIKDVEADRKHPRKRNRPIASGKLSIRAATIAAIVLLVLTLVPAFFLSYGFFAVCVAYLLINIAYSTWLKHIPLIDVIIIAAGFVLRAVAGVSVINVVRFSPWLYVVITLFALYIGFGKRRAELTTLADDANSHRRVLEGYTIPFLDQLITIVSSTTIITYSLYTFTAPNVPTDYSMMLTIPFVVYGIFRYLYLISVKQEGGAPEELLLTDRALQITVALWGLSVILVFYIFR